MSFIGWLALGVIAGLVAHMVCDGRRANWALDVTLGVAGALGGGFMFWNFDAGDIDGLSHDSLLVAAIGAIVVLLSYHALDVYPGDRGE